MSAGVAVAFREKYGRPNCSDLIYSRLACQRVNCGPTVYSLVTKSRYSGKPSLADYDLAFDQGLQIDFKSKKLSTLVCLAMGCVRDLIKPQHFIKNIVKFHQQTGACVIVVSNDQKARRSLWSGLAHDKFVETLTGLIASHLTTAALSTSQEQLTGTNTSTPCPVRKSDDSSSILQPTSPDVSIPRLSAVSDLSQSSVSGSVCDITRQNNSSSKAAVKSTGGKENEPVNENTTKKKTKEEKPPTKVVIRRLPPTMTEEQFTMQVSPMPEHDYFYFVPADMSLMPNAFSRAYINFTDQNDLFIFTEKFDGYVFVDSKGNEFPAVVEFAPFQRIPKNRPTRKKDSKVGTIEADPIYIAFKERMEAENLENKTATNVSKQHFFETSSGLDKKEEVSNTPLLDFIRNKRAERQRIRDEKREEKRKKDLERRKAKEEQRRVKKEDETSVVKNPQSLPVNPNPKTREALPLDNLEKRENISGYKVEEKIKSNEQCDITETTKLSKEKSNDKIDKCTEELLDIFYGAINEMDANKLRPNEIIDSPLPSFRKHVDIESEILKSSEREVTSNMCLLPTPLHTQFKFPMKNDHFKSSSTSKSMSPFESGGRLQVRVPHSKRKVMFPCSHSDIVMRPIRVNDRDGKKGPRDIQSFIQDREIVRPARPIRVNIPVTISNRGDCDSYKKTVEKPFEVRAPVRVNIPINQSRRNEILKNIHLSQKVSNECNDTNNCSDKSRTVNNWKNTVQEYSVNNCESKMSEDKSEALKKNLQKVVSEVFGNTKLNSPKENINKPKTFVRRYSGFGDEEYLGKGFNNPNFYLPPRSFGFGMVDSKNPSNRNISSTYRPSSGRTPLLKKSLPPFSKKFAYLSKSDGDIEKQETVVKVGGSEENVKRLPPEAFIPKRPFGAPGVSAVRKNNA